MVCLRNIRINTLHEGNGSDDDDDDDDSGGLEKDTQMKENGIQD
jgi:hypothetical protein